jgi:DNA helicase-2/ATP-dependent DNA helicase PcrA
VPGRQRFPLAETCLAIASRCVNTGEPLPAVLARHHPWCAPHENALRDLFAAFAAAKQAQHALDFDDLLLAWHALLQHPHWGAALRARWDHVLVDEVQDLNALQAEIVHALRPGGQGLTAVGDDAQSIYGFRGAHPRHILGLPARCSPPAQVLALTRNHRSTPALLAASNAVIAGWVQGFPKALWSTRAPGPLPRLVTVADEAAQARGVADAVLAAREQGTALRRQAVLFRTGTHSAALELELARRQIPYVKYGGLKFLESAHVKDLLALLRWADNPAATLAAQRVARRVSGLGPATVARLATHAGALEALPVPRAAAPGWAALCALMQALRGGTLAWPADLRAALDWLAPQLERLHDDARVRIAELEQLALLAAGHGSRSAFVTALALDPPAASGDEAGAPLRDEDWLVLSTIHAAKGQEWSAVHVLHVVDGGIPSDMATGDAEAVEEERRLLYVAMTRARDSLHLWVPQRFYVTQQRTRGDAHVYALRSRFLPDALLPLFDIAAPGDDEAGDAAGSAKADAGPHGAAPDAASAGSDAAPDAGTTAAGGAGFDLWGELRAASGAAARRD